MQQTKRLAGLTLRGRIWHIDKLIRGGGRLCESTGQSEIKAAESVLIRRLEEIERERVHGLAPIRNFEQAAVQYLADHELKKSLGRDVQELRTLVRALGHLALHQVHAGTAAHWVRLRQRDGVSNATINRGLAVLKRILVLCSRRWRDKHTGTPWLLSVPEIPLLPTRDSRKPFPLHPSQWALLYSELPPHLRAPALFKVHTGTREREIVALRWSWEQKVDGVVGSVFVVPGSLVKNGEDRVIILNSQARWIVEECRGNHPAYVFTYSGRGGNSRPRPFLRMNNTAWRSARRRASARYFAEFNVPAPEGFKRLRVHDLKHTFGKWLRAGGVSFEDRQDLLGHKSSRITTHYSVGELEQRQAAAEKAVDVENGIIPLTIMRVKQ